jgi:O-antigen/teichoic acid export membrane protein
MRRPLTSAACGASWQEEIMAIKDILKTHRTWEDGAGLALGLMIGLSPWFYDEPVVPAVLLNSGLIGLAVLVLAQLELVHLRRWEELAQLACGLWLSASPFIFDYAHQDHLRLWHWVLGSIVSVLALLELWQDWNRAHNEPQG